MCCGKFQIVFNIDTLIKAEYFGEFWESGLCRNGTAVAAPVGQPCAHCDLAMSPYDRGTFIQTPEGRRPVHRECTLRMVLGSPAHLRRECSCFGQNVGCSEGPTTPEGKRAEAIESWKIYRNRTPTVKLGTP